MLVYRHALDASDRFSQPQKSRRVRRGVREDVERPTLRVEGRELHNGTGARRDPEKVLRVDLVLRALELESGAAGRRHEVTAVSSRGDPIADQTNKRLPCRAVVRVESRRDLAQGRSRWGSDRERHERAVVQVTALLPH